MTETAAGRFSRLIASLLAVLRFQKVNTRMLLHPQEILPSIQDVTGMAKQQTLTVDLLVPTRYRTFCTNQTYIGYNSAGDTAWDELCQVSRRATMESIRAGEDISQLRFHSGRESKALLYTSKDATRQSQC